MAPRITSIESIDFGYPNTQPPTYEDSYSVRLDTTADDRTDEVPEGASLEYDWVYIEENDTSSVHIYD